MELTGDWHEELGRLRARGRAGVLVTVLSTRGHAPREAGAKMVVAADGSWDSIGGGNLEQTAIEHARSLLAPGSESPQILELSLTEHAPAVHGRQCCGGQVSLLFERIGAPPVVAIFGVGHVGLETARMFSRLSVTLHLVDSREEQAGRARALDLTESRAQVEVHHAPAPETVMAQLPAGAHVLIMTHDHAEDLFLCEAALGREDLGYAGLIGSRAKWARFRRRLQESGHPEEHLDRITCPIGLSEVPGKDPVSIAVSVVADYLRRGSVGAPGGASA
ncbi:xanthine dehydrogenase accessory protein XdhC [Nesterenkonia sp. CL21]|uniref:xanthine dehydrogenase accessory protein XdhC n=1 Tax=Nesterenkonia sp. CL21 TaxID=3064894 RepID=UPI00287B77BB|nr:xanthine dehydrogenase accessory protein XdhC [Nesterenkonia sp. CL21]